MKRISYIAAGAVLLGSFAVFQNCGKTSNNSTETIQGDPFIRSDADAYSVLKINEMGMGNGERFLKIDLEKETIFISDREDFSSGTSHPLPEEDKTALENILDEAQLCEPAPVANPDDRICTMQYVFPYVELMHGSIVKKLGEKSNGCATPTDLCDGKATELKSLLQKILDDTENLPH